MGFMDEVKEESKKYGAGQSSDYFNFSEKGIYRLRILHQPKTIATHFFGKGNPSVVCVGIDEGCQYHGQDEKKPSIKLATYVIDRSDGKVKLAELPLSVGYYLQGLQEDSDFAFTEFPMPYDVKITYDPDNSDPKSIYRLVPSPKQEPLTPEEGLELAEKLKNLTPEQHVALKKQKQKDKSSGNVPAGRPKYDTAEADEQAANIPF